MEKEEQEFIDKFVGNSVTLQRIMTDAVVSMNRLTKEIEELVNLFKEAAKTVEERKDSELMAKIYNIADQNKTMAKSLTLMMEKDKPRPLPEYKF